MKSASASKEMEYALYSYLSFPKQKLSIGEKKGYKFVLMGQIDFLIKPHFKYELNAEYLISLLDVRQIEWQDALICQFCSTLNKDGMYVVQPNFTLSS